MRKELLLAFAPVLMLITGAGQGDCVTCTSEQDCTDEIIYDPFDHCEIFYEGGKRWYNMVGECSPQLPDQPVPAFSAAGAFIMHTGESILSADGRFVVTPCGNLFVNSIDRGRVATPK
jgi:hypothetical protein